jgi:hypothetical protein
MVSQYRYSSVTLLKQCIACQATDVKTHKAPLIMSSKRSAKWVEISIDLKVLLNQMMNT